MMSVDAENLLLADLKDTVVRTFRHEAERRNLSFDVVIDPALDRGIVTDSKRLQQVLKNLLFKCLQVHRNRRRAPDNFGGARRLERRPSGLEPRPFRRSLRGLRHRNRYPAREAKNIFEAFQRPMRALAGNTAGPVWASRLAVSWRPSSAAKFSFQSTPGQGSVSSRSICR